mgnify:FL=1
MSYVDKINSHQGGIFIKKTPLVRNGQPKYFAIPHLLPTFINEMIQKS